VLREEQVSKVP